MIFLAKERKTKKLSSDDKNNVALLAKLQCNKIFEPQIFML
jgi:hypothetical protein